MNSVVGLLSHQNCFVVDKWKKIKSCLWWSTFFLTTKNYSDHYNQSTMAITTTMNVLRAQHSAVQCSAVQCSAVQCSAVQYKVIPVNLFIQHSPMAFESVSEWCGKISISHAVLIDWSVRASCKAVRYIAIQDSI